MLDKIKGLKKYTDCSMPANENELRAKESVAGYNQAIEDVVKIFSIYDVSNNEVACCGNCHLPLDNIEMVKKVQIADKKHNP